jgi:hypothetical protein
VTATVLAPAPATSGTRNCRHCHLPIMVCPALAEGYLTRCAGWVHVPPMGLDYGRHHCGVNGMSSQAEPERPKRETDD